MANRIDLTRSEDTNGNGVLDAGEDLNHNGRFDSPALNPNGPVAMQHVPTLAPNRML